MTTTLYGIKNCDTVRAARKWLDAQQIDYHFHDVREHALGREQLDTWLQELGLELVNRRSTTWKQLDQASRDELCIENAAELLLSNPTLMKRPLLDTGKSLTLGFKAADYQQLFAHHTL